MKIAIPTLNECCALLQPVETQTSSGGLQTTWEYISKKVYAQVNFPGTGTDERFLGDQQVATTTVEFIIRFRTDIDEKCRLEYRGKQYDILNLLEYGPRRSYLRLQTEIRE